MNVLDWPADKREAIGTHALSAMQLAKDEGCFLFSDDMILRALAKSECGLQSFSTIWFLESLVGSGDMDAETKHDLIIKLIEMKYFYVGVSADLLAHVVKQTQYAPTGHVPRVFALLNSPETNAAAAIGVVSLFFKAIWGQLITDYSKDSILNLAAEHLLRGRSSSIQILRALLARIDLDFGLDVIHSTEVKQGLLIWAQTHILNPNSLPPGFARLV